jgi:tRNA modification GTPase
VLARVEAYIDFPEEDLPPEDRGMMAEELERLSRETDRLLATSHYGAMLRDGIRTVIVGPPNVGKSSLLNRLVGRERALVSPEPGTTRDFIEERIMVGPHSLRIVDTAGLNVSPAPLEKLGIAKTFERVAEADLLLVVLDATRPAVVLPNELLARIHSKSTLGLLNKIDLAADAVAPDGLMELGVAIIRISARTGAGLTDLVEAITQRADLFQLDVGGEIIAINARHAHSLTQAREWLREAQAKLRGDDPVELLASDLRGVLAAYGEIVGKVDNEQMLDRLFAKFCIGK